MADLIDSLESGAQNIWNSFDLTKFLQASTQAYVAIKNAGQTAATVVAPGTQRVLPDGSRLMINADGSMTVVSPSGQVQTVNTNGQLMSGAFASTWIPGVPNVALIAAGAALVLFAFLRR